MDGIIECRITLRISEIKKIRIALAAPSNSSPLLGGLLWKSILGVYYSKSLICRSTDSGSGRPREAHMLGSLLCESTLGFYSESLLPRATDFGSGRSHASPLETI